MKRNTLLATVFLLLILAGSVSHFKFANFTYNQWPAYFSIGLSPGSLGIEGGFPWISYLERGVRIDSVDYEATESSSSLNAPLIIKTITGKFYFELRRPPEHSLMIHVSFPLWVIGAVFVGLILIRNRTEHVGAGKPDPAAS